jgi:hypothetical protein
MNTEFRKSLSVILVLMDLAAINFAWLITYLLIIWPLVFSGNLKKNYS